MKKKSLNALVIFCCIAIMAMLPLIVSCTQQPTAPQSNSPQTSTPAPAPAPETIEWDMVIELPPGAVDTEWFKNDPGAFPQLVNAASGGRIVINTFGAGEIVPPTQYLEAVGSGAVDAMMGAGPYFAGQVPAGIFTMQSFLLQTNADVDTYNMDLGVYEILKEAYAEHNNQLLNIAYSGRGFLCSKKPINSLNDFKGMKIRVAGMANNVLQDMGAAMVQVGASEMYTSLQTGVIDAGTYGGPVLMLNLGLPEVTDYLLLDPPAVSTAVLQMVNTDRWNELDDELKAIVRQSAEMSAYNFARWTEYESLLAVQTMLDGGMQANRLSAADKAVLVENTMAFLDGYAKDDRSRQCYNILKDYIEAGILDF